MKSTVLVSALALVISHAACAKVSQDLANQLGNELTPLGGTLQANADGSIPAWQGGLSSPPENYRAGGHLIDPFASDAPLFTIDAASMAQHQEYLTEGQKALFKRYPNSYRMPIYPSRRTAYLPPQVTQKARQNALTSELVDSGNGVENFDAYYPFPIPENALEVLWNHFLRYRGGSLLRDHSQIITQTNGDFHEVKMSEEAVNPENLDGYDARDDANVMTYFRQVVTAPSRLTGNVLLVHETINQVKQPRNAWIYNAGQRRVRRAPQVAYDGPGTASSGLRTSDNFDMFTGAPDRYNWHLDGKVEKYIPYNSFKLAASDTRYEDLIQPGHLNPEYLRYEKHRVWKVVATLKEGMRHIYAKREFYFDEDTWQIAYVDQYDERGNLWRISEGYAVQYYYAHTPWLAGESVIDLIAGRYLVMGLHSESDQPVRFGQRASKADFTPAAIRRIGKR